MIQDQYYTQLNEAKKYTSFETNFIQLATGNIFNGKSGQNVIFKDKV